MNKVISLLFTILLLGSCATQQKTVELANGEMITEKQYQKKLDKAFKYADKEARKAVKGKMSKKEIREFRENLSVESDTLSN